MPPPPRPSIATLRPDRVLRADAAVVASRMETALAERTWSIAERAHRRHCQLFFVLHGRAIFTGVDGHVMDLLAPVMLWLPRPVAGEFRLEAGSDGVTAMIAEDFVWRVIGDSPVAAHLRPMLERAVVAPGERIAPQLAEIGASLNALVRESREPQAGGAAMMALHFGIVMLHLWRASGRGTATTQRGSGVATVQRFRQLVELHYRENLGIDEYADRLGVTRAHLHDACLRATQETPLALVHVRLLEEAQSRLEQTDLSVEQIGYSLGFRDPSYFNRFFKRLSGMTPGAYRQRGPVAASPREPASFAAWP
ncbi:AraC family transcriptional regulator [Kaistia dalseonensis]|uniref:AraC family transcriptional activator of pobA n=1 Tax=Kaistia dalseonensis TaxID=410840 RepID=A0ABU0HB14_9HYPH|nr:AraC family transcriptional regulator [Kaistia dalseonensis]MCX5496067.1 AraC family transcriptional regulator [Kaistia dalseonensis]MDQ0438671.1 AraC family transcriptional activator of pobA [Kaistia dalseonensis]